MIRHRRHFVCHHRPSLSAGLTLVELMVAMTLGLILTAGVVTVVVSTNSSHRELGNASRQIENGRYALQVLADDIRHAGFFGQFFVLDPPMAAPGVCDISIAGLAGAMMRPMQGFSAVPAGCDGSMPGYVTDTDVLVIRRAATVPTALAALSPGTTYLQTRAPDERVGPRPPAAAPVEGEEAEGGPSNSEIFDLKERDGTTPAAIRRYLTHVYYMRNCSVCADGGDGIPTLVRLELGAGGFSAAPIAEGIENLQLRYAVDTTGDGVPDGALRTAADVGNWQDVMAVEVNLLARGIESSPGYSDQKTYTLGDVTIEEPGDQFKRHAFTTVVRAVNLSGRRER